MEGDEAPLSRFWRSFPAELKLLAVVSMLQMLSMSAYQPLVPQLAVSLGAGGGLLGLLFTVSGIVPLVVSLPVGTAIDRLGVRRVLIWGTASRAVSGIVLWIWPSLPVLLGSLVLMATSLLLIEVAQQTYIAAAGGGQKTERYLGWFTFVMGIGMVAGPYLGGMAADMFGYRAAFAGAGAAAAIGMPGVYILRRRKAHSVQVDEPLPWGRALRGLVSNRGVFSGVAIATFLYFALGSWQIYLPAYLQTQEYTSTQVGQVVSAFTLLAMLARPTLSRMTAALGRRGLAVLSLMATGIGLIMIPLFPEMWFLLLIAALMGAGRGLLPLLSVVVISDHSHPANRGLALSFRMMSIRLAAIVYPAIFGVAAAVAGMGAPFAVAGVLGYSRWFLFSAPVQTTESAPVQMAEEGPASRPDPST